MNRHVLVFAFMRRLRSGSIFVLFLIASQISRIESARAQVSFGPTIFDVRRSLPLEPGEAVTKDFYINVGPESGLKTGVFVSVIRVVPIHDPVKNVQQATLKIQVGKLKVIDVQHGITVARLETELTDDDRPTVEFEGIMIGDQIDLATITSEVPKKPKPKAAKVAVTDAAPDPAPAPVAIPLTPNANVKASSEPVSSEPARQPEDVPTKTPAPESADAQSDDVNRFRPVKNAFPAQAGPGSVRVADTADVGI